MTDNKRKPRDFPLRDIRRVTQVVPGSVVRIFERDGHVVPYIDLPEEMEECNSRLISVPNVGEINAIFLFHDLGENGISIAVPNEMPLDFLVCEPHDNIWVLESPSDVIDSAVRRATAEEEKYQLLRENGENIK